MKEEPAEQVKEIGTRIAAFFKPVGIDLEIGLVDRIGLNGMQKW